MKVKPVTHLGKKLVKFWCQGCGQFHAIVAYKWNGDVEKPSFGETRELTAGFDVLFVRCSDRCVLRAQEGVIEWSKSCEHRLAGKSLPMQNEEAWRDGGNNWDEVKPPDGSKPEIKV